MKLLGIFLMLCTYVLSTYGLKDEICGLPHSADGNGAFACGAFFPMWSYDAANNQCVDFIYGGCGGNANRFGTKDACEEKCKE